jgi:hypothetical protein
MARRLAVTFCCILWCCGIAVVNSLEQQLPSLQCSLTEEELNALDPALQELTYDVGDGPQTTLVYVEPPVETMYPPGEEPPSRTKVTPKFNGLAGKFINMSNKKVTLYWYVVGSSLHGGPQHDTTTTTLVVLGRKLSTGTTTTRYGSHSRCRQLIGSGNKAKAGNASL